MSPAEQTNLERLKGVYNELLQKEKDHQERSLEYEEKISRMQDELYSRLQEEKDRSTQLTAALMAQHQRMIEGMYQLMSRIQSAVLSDRDSVPLTQLQNRLFSIGNDQLEAFNAFSVLTTNDKKTKEHIKRKALAKKMSELCEEIRSTLKSVESLLAVNTTLMGSTKKDLKESVVRIKVAIQTFLTVFGKLRLVINRGEDMSDDHVVGITPSFDRMQREIVNMPPLNCVSALEVIETGLHQLGIEDRRGQEGLDQWKEGPMDRHR